MYNHILREMAEHLEADGLISPDRHEETKQSLAKAWVDRMADVWSIEDVQTIDPDLSDNIARAVLRRAERTASPITGINWDTLAITIREELAEYAKV